MLMMEFQTKGRYEVGVNDGVTTKGRYEVGVNDHLSVMELQQRAGMKLVLMTTSP